MPKRTQLTQAIEPAAQSFEGLVRELRSFITESRRQIVRAVDVAQVRTCWGVGRYIVEFEQGGAARAEFGTKLLAKLSEVLTQDFGKGFDASNLRYMRLFYQAFPICDALRHELSWTHYRTLLRVENADAREWYVNEAITQNWSSRALDRQICRLYYERLLSSKDKAAVKAEADEKIAELPPSPRDFVRDPVLLEFLGLPETGRLLETNLEQGLIDHLQAFLLELGKGFAFIGRQVRISTETKDFYIDLVFYNYLLKCFVIFDLKPRELTHEDIGQMDMYVRMYDELQRGPGDNPTVGIILCAARDASIARYSVLNGSEQMFASRYRLVLPTEDELRIELIREQRLLEERMPASASKLPG
ncbi:MAG: YhcG family protein [Prosthecobacter sp.]|uniref:PDDEXK nuclease domain-containing protein n=1 Tax=Prosthecobacter sp. TaxID=1965333 RepID=UPI0038FD7986